MTQLVSTKKLAVILLILPCIGIILTAILTPYQKKSPDASRTYRQTTQNNSNTQENTQVLAANDRSPQIYIYGEKQEYSAGGVIAIASTDEAAVHIGGYRISGPTTIAIYQTNEDALLDYITHDKDSKQTQAKPLVSKLHYQTTIKTTINTGDQGDAKVLLPLAEQGIWYLKMSIGKNNTDAFVIRSNIAALAEEGDNELIFWGQNFKTKRSITDGVVILYSLLNGRKELERASFNSDGIAKSKSTGDADIALIAQNNERAIVPLNLKYLNLSYNSSKTFQEKLNRTRYFIFTDRPLYKPGDTVNFKAILRTDDDARYTIPTGQATATVYNGYYYPGSTMTPEFEQSYTISPDGTISGQYQIPQDAKVGEHTLNISLPDQSTSGSFFDNEFTSSTISYDVEFFRKPEYTIDVTTPKTEYIAGDNTSFTIDGRYFSGQPLMNQKVKYTVYSSDFYEYQYLQDQKNLEQTIHDEYRYGYTYSDNKVLEGTAELDKNGKATINLNTKIPSANGKNHVFSIEATVDDSSQNPAFSRRNLLIYAGDFNIYRNDSSSGGKVNTTVSLPLTLLPIKSETNISNIDLTAKVVRENWVATQQTDQKYPTYKKEEETLPKLTATTDNEGKATLTFTPTKVGSYTFTVEGKDVQNNLISKVFYAYITNQDVPQYTPEGNNDLTLTTDKQKYEPSDTAHITIFSAIPNRDVLLTLERGRVNRYQVVHLNSKNAQVDIPLQETDIPNIYTKIQSFDDYHLNASQANISISTASKKIKVAIAPNSKKFGPGETVQIDLQTTDTSGNPVSSDVAFWAVDKAIFELSDNKLGNIFNTFWNERWNTTQETHSLEGIIAFEAGGRGGGCFAAGTKVRMADGTTKNIEQIKAGENILTRKSANDKTLVQAKVINTHQVTENGYLIINDMLKVTPNHKLWINHEWKEAGSLQKGDILLTDNNEEVKVHSIEWQRTKANVYNLSIEKYHTYFANGIWVHNEKGVDRSTFKDTAYWNPTIHTDSNGKAQVSFVLPDNLTTWTLAAVASTTDTKVGQATNEIEVTKDVVLRPILPNILRVGDNLILSALIQNFTEQDHTFTTNLHFTDGEVKSPTTSEINVKAKEIKQISWEIKPTKENKAAQLIFSAKAKDNGKLADSVTQQLPILAFGFEEQKAQTGQNNTDFLTKFATDSKKERSTITLSLSSTILGTLPTAMNYLIDYPYGCVEQTTSRFVPSIIAKTNPEIFASVLKEKDIDDIIQKGVNRLATQQQGDGGWTWWFSGKSDQFITAYVIEYLLQAKQAGTEVDQQIFNKALQYLEQEQYFDGKSNDPIRLTTKENIARMYGLTLLGATGKTYEINSLNGISPDLVALAVMSNYLNGDKNPGTNGLNYLISLAQKQGDAVFWEAGDSLNFGSKDASTALAIRAILLAGGDRSLAVKGAIYLGRVRKFNYWSNTYATAQVVRALTELSKTQKETDPNYTYKVTIDNKSIAQGTVTQAQEPIPDIKIPAANIKATGSHIAISKQGNGQLYSTLIVNEFRTDKKAPAQSHGLSIKKEFVNEKGEEYSLGIGSTVLVRITVAGLKAKENYGVINDELPAGMIPINDTFKNEQYNQTLTNSYDAFGKEITQNGEVLSLYQMEPGEKTYTYKARVISEGTFSVPPATVSLMYAPEIYGRSQAQTITLDKESHLLPQKALKKIVTNIDVKQYVTRQNKIVSIILLIIIIVSTVLILFKRDELKKLQLMEKIKTLWKDLKGKVNKEQ
jgi:uncharacterized protein YfaS (alpha-2-macroglobulin family)